MEQKEKKRSFLRWPWNAVIYVLLALTLQLFSIPIILLLVWLQHKNDPHGASEGYCLSRTRKRLTGMIWALVCLVIAVGLGVVFFAGRKLDRTYWERSDYITLAVSGVGSVLLGIWGLYLCYTSARDTFFPEKSALAQSIRDQIRYPGRSPAVKELFALVDGDLKENGLWFGPVGVGKEWVLGDTAVRIDHVRGIFTVDEIHQHQTQTGVRTSRNLELVLIDDRWQRFSATFRDPQDLKAAADCVALRAPDARRGKNDEYLSFWNMDQRARDRFERDFAANQKQRSQQESQQPPAAKSVQKAAEPVPPAPPAEPEPTKSYARLSLVYASGAAENHTTFTREDVELAADGIADGTYQLVELTHPEGYFWIRAAANGKTCTVEATRPEGPELGFYRVQMTPSEAAAWLTGYPREPFLPGGGAWERMEKS